MNEDDIIIGCLNKECGHMFRLDELVDASNYEFIPICVCPKYGYYNLRIFPIKRLIKK